MRLSILTAAIMAAIGVSIPAAKAQLPATTWGKSVHTPGDNQYAGGQQDLRHPPPPPRPIIQSGGGGGGGSSYVYRPTPSKPKPDVSIQPIPADEPIGEPGFPPLPERLDLPGIASNSMTFTATSAFAGGGGGRGGGGASASNPYQGKKQGYSHYEPGAFSDQKRFNGGGGGGGAAPSGGGGGGGEVEMHQHYGHVQPGAFADKRQSPGYYKARTPAPIQKDDTFSSTEGAAGAGAGTGRAMKGLGKEPKLDDRAYGAENGAPEAPTPVQINQASTQDLSLPDDDFDYRKPPSKAGRYAKRKLKQGAQRGRNIMRRVAPVPIGF